jgi:hypothetical protein
MLSRRGRRGRVLFQPCQPIDASMAVALPGAALFGLALSPSLLVDDSGLIFRLLEGQRRVRSGHGGGGTGQ